MVNSPVLSPTSPTSPTSPSKRKTDSSESSDEALQEGRYKSAVKVYGQEEEDAKRSDIGAPPMSSASAQVALGGSRNEELIMGLDPNREGTTSSYQEMQERSSMRFLSTIPGDSTANTKPIDIMDLDQVMEDNHVAQESDAVKHVDFVD